MGTNSKLTETYSVKCPGVWPHRGLPLGIILNGGIPQWLSIFFPINIKANFRQWKIFCDPDPKILKEMGMEKKETQLCSIESILHSGLIQCCSVQ